MMPQSQLLENYTDQDYPDGSCRPHELSEGWYSWGENSDAEYQKGILFCALYRKDRRSRREEAELGTAYWGAYQAAFATVARIAHKAGLQDPDTISDCATGLVDFCAREYDPAALGRGNQPKTFFAFLKNIAYAYLRKHRDFLAFSKKLTGSGLSSQDLMTAAIYRDAEGRLDRVSVSESDDRDVFDTLNPDTVESLYAGGWSSLSADEEPDEIVCDIDTLDDKPMSLRDWVDYLLDQICHSGLSSSVISSRAPEIIEQFRSATGARLMDIIKRLITKLKAGCREAYDLLCALRASIPEHHERTHDILKAVLEDTEEALQSFQQENDPAISVEPSPVVQPVTMDMNPDISDPAKECHPCVIKPDDASNVLEAAVKANPAEGYDNDLGFLIDVSDLRHGRIPPAKARFVVVEAPPPEPQGPVPILDNDPGPPGTENSRTSEGAVAMDRNPPRRAWFKGRAIVIDWMPRQAGSPPGPKTARVRLELLHPRRLTSLALNV